MSTEGLDRALSKMRDGGVHQAAIDVFAHYYRELESGATGLIAEGDIEPLRDPPRLADIGDDEDAGRAALDATVVIKLNGGLGTSMGLQGAKSLLTVRQGLSFLDIIARQVLYARQQWGVRLPLVFMNSFRTRDDTLEALSEYPDLATDGLPLDFLQNREPKLRADDLTPVEWPADPSLEWCPPGHGDLYTALSGSGLLQDLLDAGVRYAFVSNGDNLCATADPRVASWFANSGAPYAAEVCRRTAADRKGGQLAVRKSDGRLVLRDTAQTAPEDADAFADVNRHQYFHTNNLWFDLRAVASTLEQKAGVLGLPLIRNEKTVDPADASSPKVIQIETAMGAAVEVFEGAQALEVERARFLPVKSTNDLLALRSDAYDFGDSYTPVLVSGREEGPYVDLDPDHYKLVADFDARFPEGPPSLAEATSLRVEGDWTFEADVVVRGDVTVAADGSPGTVTSGTVLS
ncbi:MAG TPA: UTP--glucose-1-phosphate uridylyltransferase [Nocardioidaceae bacterium]|nr:UTP--glucose-1-phosphate uridylyltransferase [Nocardioidaceae bacterium]